jgi:hypothetical protein
VEGKRGEVGGGKGGGVGGVTLRRAAAEPCPPPPSSRQAATPPPRGSEARECSVLTFRPPARRPAWQETDPQETEPEVRKEGNTGML